MSERKLDGYRSERRHHNNTGYRRIKRGKLKRDVEIISRKLGII